MRLPATLITGIGAAAACACASAGGVRAGRSCELAPADSSYLTGGPVYRDCAVDQRARLIDRGPVPELDFLSPPMVPPPSGLCYSVEIIFVVDTAGVAEEGTARVVRSTDPRFADAVVRTLPMRRYRPATKGGTRVRQVVRTTESISVQVVAVGAGALRGAGRPRRC